MLAKEFILPKKKKKMLGSLPQKRVIIIIIIINLFIQCRNITQNNLDVESWGGCANSTEKKINFEKLKRKQSKGKHGKVIKVKSY